MLIHLIGAKVSRILFDRAQGRAFATSVQTYARVIYGYLKILIENVGIRDWRGYFRFSMIVDVVVQMLRSSIRMTGGKLYANLRLL
jgi:hypothetical protein